MSRIKVQVADWWHIAYANEICMEMEASAKVRGTGIARRSPADIISKIQQGKAVIALTETGEWVGFSYVESWDGDKFVSNSGLIVSPKFRGEGVARLIKEAIFKLSRTKYPQAKVFSLTSGAAVMKLNTDLGFKPVTYSSITQSETFWKGCNSCVNVEILKSKGYANCLCTALVFDPEDAPKASNRPFEFRLYGRLKKAKQLTFHIRNSRKKAK